MKISISGLCILAVCFWGFQTGLWFLAVMPLTVLIQGQFVRRQQELSLERLKQQAKQWLLLVLVAMIILLAAYGQKFIYLIQWPPILCLPLLIGQIYIDRFTVLLQMWWHEAAASHSISFGGRSGMVTKPPPPDIIYYFYLAICIIAASAANRTGWVFYATTAVLVALVLWTLRPRGVKPIIWVISIVLASAIGFGGQIQLHQLQARIEERVAPLLSGSNGEAVDPDRTRTRVGSIGDLKQSNEIVFRVAGDRKQFPLLLREATYNQYVGTSWAAQQPKFTPVESAGDTWKLGQSQTGAKTNSMAIAISSRLDRGRAILRLPHGTTTIDFPMGTLRERLEVEEMMQNQYGTVKVRGRDNSLTYQATYHPQTSSDAPPTAADLQIPPSEQPAINKTLQLVDLKDLPADKVLDRLSSYFDRNFRYSLQLTAADNDSTPLSAFLLKQRAGHCEYFATASTLLLRGAGIPTRYVVGYSAREWSPLEGQVIVRSRHAHAWVMAYLNGKWQSFDPTPPNWAAAENATASSLFQTLGDLWSFVVFQVSKGWEKLVADRTTILLWATLAGGLFFLWRFVRRWRRAATVAIVPQESNPLVRFGLDSEFYQVDRALQNLDLHRLADESLPQWLSRIQPHLPVERYSTLKQMLDLHHRYRFDPHGLEPQEQQQLQELSRSWLDYAL